MATGNNDAIAEAAKRADGAGRMQSMAGTPGVEEKDRGAETPNAGVRGALTAESMRVQAVTAEAGENLEAVRAEMSAWTGDVAALRTQIAGIRKRLQKLRAGLAPMAAEAGTLENQQVEIMARITAAFKPTDDAARRAEVKRDFQSVMEHGYWRDVVGVMREAVEAAKSQIKADILRGAGGVRWIVRAGAVALTGWGLVVLALAGWGTWNWIFE